MVEIVIGSVALASYYLTRPSYNQEDVIEEIEMIRDLINECDSRIDKYYMNKDIILPRIQKLRGILSKDDKLYDMLEILLKEWNTIQQRMSRINQ